jgi:hypothetical protein
MICTQKGRRKARALRVEPLEGRSLLSGAMQSVHSPLVVAIFEHELHRDPRPGELAHDDRLLDRGMPAEKLALSLLTSREYFASHRTPTAFVDGLFHDVLGSDVDSAGEAYWTEQLKSRAVGRASVAKTFLGFSNSFLNQGLGGSIVSVSTTGSGWSSGTSGNSTAFVAGTYNRGMPSTVQITIQVTAGGQYVLSQSMSNGSFVGNNSGNTWSGFTLAIQSSSTAGASFVSSSDTSGHFSRVSQSASTITFSGGSVTSGSNVIVNGFQPYTTITATKGGTIVINETPINA